MQSQSEILVYNFTKNRVSVRFIRETIEQILCFFKKTSLNISLVLVPKSEMKKLNSYWRHKAKATTILTFSEGDIFLCPAEIQKQARKRKISNQQFYQILLIHGILHLMGYTHNTKKNSNKMEKLEQKILTCIQN